MILGLVMLAIGLSLSALFSGSETGFYRVSRVRLLLESLDGDRLSRWLLWLSHHPALFVATALVGNNLANYLVSLAVVVLTKHFAGSDGGAAGLAATVLFSPVVFVYGELLPKYLYFHAPNRLLGRSGPVFLFFVLLFIPVTAALWALGRMLESLIGETPLRARSMLARKELEEVLQEGQEAGILKPMQQRAAQNLLASAARPIGESCLPPGRVAIADELTPPAQLVQLAQRRNVNLLVLTRAGGAHYVGYVRVVELSLAGPDRPPLIRPLVRLPRWLTSLDALIRMRTERLDLAEVHDGTGRTVGVLFAADLANLFAPGGR